MSDVKENDKSQSQQDDSFPTIISAPSAKEIGRKIGPYKLLSVLGEGGFGMVYLAEQYEPVRRRVALKVIKPGMDTKQVIARFEAERQALALLDHPNIAHVFDAGTTETGRPYFALELVKGLPITEHCDQHKLGIEERLELFQQVCDAVQHAHQKGIIHRDLKPSNILVHTRGGKPVPMIIDFGVAKAINQPLTERTLFTEQGQFVGTPEYMSPEQAGITIEDIDTRSDIYSLGIILYELLTGTLPFTRKELKQAGFAEILRTIREVDPPHPRTRLSSLGDKANKIAERRCIELATLTKRLHKELEWIPLKAMRKEPDQRYQTASEFAQDVRNYLKGDPLLAGPESATYRLKKAIKRNRALLTGLAAVLVVLIAGIIVSTMMYVAADKAHREAVAARAEVDKLRAEESMRRQIAEAERDKAREAEHLAEQRLSEVAAARDEASQERKNAEAVANFLKSANKIGLSDHVTSDMDLAHIAGSDSLRYLYVENTEITDEDLVHIKALTSLETFFLGKTKITDSGMANLKNLSGLKRLCVHRTQVSDAGLAFLKNLTSLEYLCLNDTKVSDGGLVYLSGLTSLQDLKLQGTQITKAGFSDLKQVLPNCDISGTAAFMPGEAEIPVENLKIPEELQACAVNFQKIYAATKKYETDKGTLPNWLSDLVPDYLSNEVLFCPSDTNHQARYTPDPNLPCSYEYEFSPIRNQFSGDKSMRDWKEQQVREFGDVVPIVICFYHGSGHEMSLNISVGGQIYWCPWGWELLFGSAYKGLPEQPSLVGKSAPPFTLTDMNGHKISLSHLKGKVVLLDFWATWCGPCKRAIPHLEALHKKYEDQGLILIGMNHEEDHEKVREFVKGRMSYTVLLGADKPFEEYDINGIPTAYFIDREGIIRDRDVGFVTGKEKEMEQKIKALLAGGPFDRGLDTYSEILDQYQTITNYGFWFEYDVIRWQEFIPELNTITSVEVAIHKFGKPGDMIVEIRTTDDITLAEQIIAEADVPSYGWARVEFTTPVSLTPGTKYRIYVYSNTDSLSPENRYFWRGNTTSSYYPPCNTDVSTDWPNYDYAFKTYGTYNTIATVVSNIEDFESGNFSTFYWEHEGDAVWRITANKGKLKGSGKIKGVRHFMGIW